MKCQLGADVAGLGPGIVLDRLHPVAAEDDVSAPFVSFDGAVVAAHASPEPLARQQLGPGRGKFLGKGTAQRLDGPVVLVPGGCRRDHHGAGEALPDLQIETPAGHLDFKVVPAVPRPDVAVVDGQHALPAAAGADLELEASGRIGDGEVDLPQSPVGRGPGPTTRVERDRSMLPPVEDPSFGVPVACANVDGLPARQVALVDAEMVPEPIRGPRFDRDGLAAHESGRFVRDGQPETVPTVQRAFAGELKALG